MTASSEEAANTSKAVVVTRIIWKIFGARADEGMAATRRGNLSKADILERFEAVVGLRDASISVSKGEIFSTD